MVLVAETAREAQRELLVVEVRSLIVRQISLDGEVVIADSGIGSNIYECVLRRIDTRFRDEFAGIGLDISCWKSYGMSDAVSANHGAGKGVRIAEHIIRRLHITVLQCCADLRGRDRVLCGRTIDD